MSELLIRPANESDVDVVVEFNRRLAAETEDKALDAETLRAGVLAGLADARRARYFLAEVEGWVVGQLMLTTEWSDWRNGDLWWFQSVYVAADHRRRGVFRRLFEHVLATAERDPGVVGLRLYVEDQNEVAQRTYRQLGLSKGGYHVMERIFVRPEEPTRV